jgi:hypothetical protein
MRLHVGGSYLVRNQSLRARWVLAGALRGAAKVCAAGEGPQFFPTGTLKSLKIASQYIFGRCNHLADGATGGLQNQPSADTSSFGANYLLPCMMPSPCSHDTMGPQQSYALPDCAASHSGPSILTRTRGPGMVLAAPLRFARAEKQNAKHPASPFTKAAIPASLLCLSRPRDTCYCVRWLAGKPPPPPRRAVHTRQSAALLATAKTWMFQYQTDIIGFATIKVFRR